MIKQRRTPLWLALLPLLLFGAVRSAGGVGFTVLTPGPTGVVRVTRPTLVWRIFPKQGTIVSDALMSINGVVVRPAYSPEWGAIYFTPQEPLPPGPYEVQCQVQVEDRDFIGRKQGSWEFRIAPDAVDTLPLPDEKQREAFSAANALRKKLALPLFGLDLRLCASAMAHSRYTQRNRKPGHDEIPTQPGFTGEQPHQRMRAFNYAGLTCAEAFVQMGGQDGTSSEAVQSLFDAPYHREFFLNPALEEFGAGTFGAGTTLNAGSYRPVYVGPPRLMLYPLPNEKDVPLTFPGNETPDPLRMHRADTPTGYVITYFGYATDNPIIQVIGARLTDAEGKEVPIYVNSPANDEELKNGAFLIPQKPLEPGTRYTATVQARTFSGINLSRTWSFTTVRK